MTKIYQNNLVTSLMLVKNLNIKKSQVSHVNEDSDPVDITLNKYVYHPSILKIKDILPNLLSLIFR